MEKNGSEQKSSDKEEPDQLALKKHRSQIFLIHKLIDLASVIGIADAEISGYLFATESSLHFSLLLLHLRINRDEFHGGGYCNEFLSVIPNS